MEEAGEGKSTKNIKLILMLKARSLLIFSAAIIFIAFGLVSVRPAKAATILSENFDGNLCYMGQQCSIPPPTGWYNGDSWWSLGRLCGTVYRGTGNYAASAFHGDPYSSSVLATKSLSMNSANSYTLTFYARVAGSCNYGSGSGLIGVYRSTSQSVTGTMIGSASGYNLNTTWTLITINFTVPSTGIWYLQFLAPSGTGDNSVIDDVIVNETAASDIIPPTVGQTSPTSATVNVAQTYSALVSDNVGVTSCNLYVGGVSQGAMSGSFPCASCTASKSHTFTSSGSYAMYASCSDAAGHTTNGTSVNVSVSGGATVPAVTTGVSTMSFDRDNNQAVLTGTVTNNGGATVTQTRFCWGTTAGSYPNCTSPVSYSSSPFQYTLTGMTLGQTYYYKAQAYNSVGWSSLGSTNERAVVVFTADGSQQTFNTCLCTTNTVGGCCDGCNYCLNGKVNNGSGQCVNPSVTYYCGIQNSCVANQCSGDKYYLSCNGSGSCRTDTAGAYHQVIYASQGYVFDSICNNINYNFCGYSGYNKCGGVGVPYSCQKGRDQYRCNGSGACSYDVGDDWANVTAGYVCSGGSEIAANTTYYYCGFSAYNGRSTDKCEKKKDYLACNGSNVCSYGDYGDAYDNVSIYKIANAFGQEVDATSGDNTGICHSCAEGACSGYYRWGECNGSGSAVPCTYYQQVAVHAEPGHTLTSECGIQGTTNCETNQCRDGSGWHHLCPQMCDAVQSCSYWVDSGCVDHCVNGIKDCNETAPDCGGSCSPCAGTPTVTTNAASSVEGTTAYLNGYLNLDGGAACSVWFEWGDTIYYSASTTPLTGQVTGASFASSLSSLAKGKTYHSRAKAQNTAGASNGSDVTFITKPDAPTGLSTTTVSSSQISLSWEKGTGAYNTKVQRGPAGGVCPSSPIDGTQVYYSTLTSVDDAGLSSNTTYCYRAWSEASEEGLIKYSDGYAQISVRTQIESSDNIRPTTAVISPPDGSWQRIDFEALINDSDAGGSGLAEDCEYMINDLANDKNTGIITRPCGEFTSAVDVGSLPGDDCSEDREGIRGEAACRVSSKSYDNAGNNSGWKSRNYRIDYTPPSVGRISCAASPGQICSAGSACTSAEQGVEKSFCATLQDPVGRVTGCWLYIDGQYKKDAVFSPLPCENNADCGISVNYAFQTSGVHTMRFSCKDAAGNYGWGEPAQVEVITNHAPKINSLRYTTSPCEFPTTETGCMVNFIVSASDEDGDPLSYSWSFGDSAYSTNQNPSHHYAEINSSPGYNVIVTVSDGRGGTASKGIVVPVVANQESQCSEGQMKTCGDCSSQACQSDGTWGACTSFGSCSPESCLCPTSRCVGTNYYSYPVHGSCQSSCECNTGSGFGQPCQVIITPNSSECTTLAVDLRVSNKSLDSDLINPSNWLNVLSNLTVNSSFSVIAVVSGSSVETVNFKFDMNRDGIYETTFSDVPFTGQNDASWISRQDDQGIARQTWRLVGSDVFIVKNLASYDQSGNHSPKVFIERGMKSAEDNANVGVSSTPPTAAVSCNKSQCGPGSSCSPDIAYNRNCAFSYGNESTDPGNDIIKSVWSIFYSDGTPWADPYLSCTDIAGTPDNEALCDLTLPPLTASRGYYVSLYVEDGARASDSTTRSFYVRREAIADFECARTEDGEGENCESLINSAGEVVYFRDKSLGSETFGGGTASISTRSWVFEDGTPASDTIQNPFVSFEKVDGDSGKTELEITDSSGRGDDFRKQVYPRIPLPGWREVIPTEQSYPLPACDGGCSSCHSCISGDCVAQTVEGSLATALGCTAGDEGCRRCDAGNCTYYASGQHGCSFGYECNSSGQCAEVVSDVCYGIPDNTQVVGCNGACQACQNGTCGLADSGTDPGNLCTGLDCDGGATKYYYGWAGTGSNTCYYMADVSAANHVCDGAGVCKIAAVQCTVSTQGASTGVNRTVCKTKVGCTGTTAGTLGNVAVGEDTYSDCAAVTAIVYAAGCGYVFPAGSTCSSICAATTTCAPGLCDGSGGCQSGRACVCTSVGYDALGTNGLAIYGKATWGVCSYDQGTGPWSCIATFGCAEGAYHGCNASNCNCQ